MEDKGNEGEDDGWVMGTLAGRWRGWLGNGVESQGREDEIGWGDGERKWQDNRWRIGGT